MFTVDAGGDFKQQAAREALATLGGRKNDDDAALRVGLIICTQASNRHFILVARHARCDCSSGQLTFEMSRQSNGARIRTGAQAGRRANARGWR